MPMFDVTVTTELRFDAIDRDELDRLSDAVMDALCDRTDNGSVSVDFGKQTMEVEVIVRHDDVNLGALIARRIALDSMTAAGLHLEDASAASEHQDHTLVPA